MDNSSDQGNRKHTLSGQIILDTLYIGDNLFIVVHIAAG